MKIRPKCRKIVSIQSPGAKVFKVPIKWRTSCNCAHQILIFHFICMTAVFINFLIPSLTCWGWWNRFQDTFHSIFGLFEVLVFHFFFFFKFVKHFSIKHAERVKVYWLINRNILILIGVLCGMYHFYLKAAHRTLPSRVCDLKRVLLNCCWGIGLETV